MLETSEGIKGILSFITYLFYTQDFHQGDGVMKLLAS